MTTTLTRDDVTIRPCDCGRLIRLGYRPESECARCGEPIASGAIGVISGDDCARGRHASQNRHGSAGYSWHECGHCGWHNLPVEVTVYPAYYDYEVDVAINDGLRRLAEAVGRRR